MIAIKGNKDDALDRIRYEIQADVYNYLQGYYGQSMDLSRVVSEAIGYGVSRGLKKLIEAQYTDDDLEQDLKLK